MQKREENNELDDEKRLIRGGPAEVLWLAPAALMTVRPSGLLPVAQAELQAAVRLRRRLRLQMRVVLTWHFPGASVTFSGAASSDPQTSALTYVWNFGDNTTGTGVAPSHSYAAVGSYTVSVTATDTLGLSATASTTATIAAQAPAANAGGPYASSIGSPVSFDGSGSSDPQGQVLTYAWDFGDGTTGSGAQSESFLLRTHGNYTATLTVTDSTYNLTGKSTASVTNGQALLFNR